MWEETREAFTEGLTFQSRGGSHYSLVSIDEKRLTLSRESTGKEVRVSRRMVEASLARLQEGEALKFQANATQGGISFTVAVEAGVVWALGAHVETDREARVFRLSQPTKGG